MHRRQPLPRLWLMTDERQGERIWGALKALPRGSGVIFRHYGLPRPERRRMLDQVRSIARRRRLLLLVAGERLLRADGIHGSARRRRDPGLRSVPVHGLAEMRAAEKAGADLLFLSPVFPTRSHPGARTLGRMRFALLARCTKLPVIALGGMNAKRAQTLPGACGWAAIDALS
jgi:thiamine-phosphate pyrophosphorylase